MVVAILGIIIALVLVGVGRAAQAGRATACRGNLRTIGIAASNYGASNKGRLPSPRTDTPAGWPTLKTDPNNPASPVREDAANPYIGWVRADSALAGAIDGPRETPVALQKGSLYDYIGSETAYKSPQDPTDRVRSYALNSFVGVMYCEDNYPLPGKISSDFSFDTRAIAQIPKPAETLLALPEWDQSKGNPGWNVNGFTGNPDITLNTTTGAFSNGGWYNVPAVWNPGEVNLTRVDGSVDAYAIQSAEMKNGDLQANPSIPETDVDLYNFKKMLLPGKIK